MLANQVFAGTFPIFVNLFPTGGAAAPPNPQAETPMVTIDDKDKLVYTNDKIDF